MTVSQDDIAVEGLVSMDQRGAHDLDPELFEWEPSTMRDCVRVDPTMRPLEPIPGVAIKYLVRPEEGGTGSDRPLVYVVRFPPGLVSEDHWHTEGELFYILKGQARVGGKDLYPGDMVYMDAKVVYGPEAAGPEGAEVLVVRRGWAKTTYV